MELRQRQEALEEARLCGYAQKSAKSKGRTVYEEPCSIRTDFQRDRDRIVHSKAFRRLKHKTQVFISPEGDHYRTRLTHTLEVAQIARTIARALALNEDLTEAIALGHDLGHTPFGHGGERTLDKLSPSGFEHCEQSLRVVDRLEKDGQGLNLTYEVRNGILNHRSSGKPETLEGRIVQLSDKIAYINHDIDDAIRAKILSSGDIPREYVAVVGETSSQRINAMIRDTVAQSIDKDTIVMSETMKKTLGGLRKFMFDRVYTSKEAEEEHEKAAGIITKLYGHYMEHPEKMTPEFLQLLQEGDSLERVVCDFVACMSDPYAVRLFQELFIPMAGVR